MKILSNLLKDLKDERLVNLTSVINNSNPMVDRIIEDESVQGVIMTNDEGSPIFTNLTLITATNYGLSLNRFGRLTQNYIKEIDIFDKLTAIRIKTKKHEVMLCPDNEFNIIVVQYARSKRKPNVDKKAKGNPKKITDKFVC